MGAAALVVVACVAVYVPAVQRFAVEKTSAVVAEKTGWGVHLDRFRLRFPLGLSVDGTQVATPAGDTLADIGRLRVHVALWPLLKGKVQVVDISLREARLTWRDSVSGMALRARVEALTAGTASLDFAEKSLRLTRAAIEGGDAAVSMGEGSSAAPPSADTLPFDWTIEVGRFELRGFGFAMDMPADSVSLSADTTPPIPSATPLDFRHIRADKAGVVVRDFRFYAGDISARFEGLHLVERSGFQVKDGDGDLAMDGGGYSLREFSLRTASSQIKGSATAGPGITDADPATPVSVELSAALNMKEMAVFAPLSDVPARLRARLSEILKDDRNATLDLSLGGTLGELRVERFEAAAPSMITLSARGTLQSLTSPEHLSGSVTVEGELSNLDFVRDFIDDRELRDRVAIPPMRLRAAADFSPEKYDLREFSLASGAGRIEGRGDFAPRAQSYAADLRITDFPLHSFLPRDSLGVVAGTLTASGHGFDVLSMAATAALDIDKLEYGSNDFGRITADIAAEGGHITGRVKGRSPMLDTDISLDGLLARDTVQTTSPRRPAPISYTLSARIDSTEVRLADTLRIPAPVTIHASASTAGTVATLRSGDLSVDISSPLPVDSLALGAAGAGGEVMRQLRARHLSPDSLQSAFPAFAMTARAGRGNFLHGMVRDRGFDFRGFSADVSTGYEGPFHIDATAVGFAAGDLTIDTLGLHAIRNGALLDYELRLANRPSTVTDLGLIRVSGSAGGRELTARVFQRNSAGATGFDFGLTASLRGETIRAEISPGPILGYELWAVGSAADTFDGGGNPGDGGDGGDWVEYATDGRLGAGLHLTGMGRGATAEAGGAAESGAAGVAVAAPVRHIALTTASLPGIPRGALRFASQGLDLASMLDLFPTAPAIGGVVSSDLTFGFHAGGAEGGTVIAAKGTLGAKDFSYESRRVADIGADIDFGSDGSGRMLLDASVGLEGRTALTAKGALAADTMDFDIDIPAIPLSVAQGLIPEGFARLSGNLDGKVRIAGPASKPDITGEVGFTDAKAEVEMTGTTLAVSPERITIAAGRVTFRDWGLVAPNNRKLSVDGSVDIANLSAPTADLTLRANDFRFVDSKHIGGSQIYGTVEFDADITARGPFDGMRVRGEVDLSEATDVVYIVRNTTEKVRDERQHIVRFVPFADSLSVEGGGAPLAPLGRAGADVLLNVDIGEGLRATLGLDEMNENRVVLIGGGDLAFSMNRQGDTRLAGRYTLSGGTLYYKPPVIPQKVFAVADGSYVEWAGEPFSPDINISATQSMVVGLDYDDGASEDVAFDITADITGSLRGLDMRFDLSAPANLAIQDQLLAMSPEGRMQQALSLMIYSQYTGPGVSSQGMGVDARAQLNQFVSKEINQWARNNLKGVDFSMGIDTRDDGMGDSQTDYSYSVSKTLFSDRVKISVGGKVSDDAASAGGVADNLLEDVTLEYRLTRRDNMFLKLYRYNTRESILEGEVTETGGGFVIRRKMNRLGDIFRRTRPKKSD